MKIKKVAYALSAALLAMPLTSQAESALSNDLFGFTGYMRTGGGLNASGQNVNKEDEHHLGRFGNEYDTYIAAAFTKDMKFDNGLWAYYHLEFNRWDGDVCKSGGCGGSGDWENDRNYLKMGGFDFLPEGSNIWVGSRKQEADFHILDYKWRRLMGTGIGYESDNFDIQYLQNDSGATTNANWYGAVSSNAIAARLRAGKLEGEVLFVHVPDFEDVDLEAQGVAESSMQLTLNYGFDSYLGMEGSSKIVAQYGTGVDVANLGWNERLSASEDDTAYKIVYDGMFTPSKGLDINPVILYESFDADDSSKETASTMTFAVRAHKTVSQGLAWVTEAAVSNFENENGAESADGIKYKVAFGPSFQMEAGYWARPVSRIMLTYIGIDDELSSNYSSNSGNVGINDSGDSSEFRIGYEFEIWF